MDLNSPAGISFSMMPKDKQTNPSNSTQEAPKWHRNNKFNDTLVPPSLNVKADPPIEVRTMRLILKYNPRFNVMNNPLCREIQKEQQMQAEIKDLRATIPWHTFERLMPKINRKLYINAYWNMIAAKRKAGYTEADTFNLTRESKKLRQQSYIG